MSNHLQIVADLIIFNVGSIIIELLISFFGAFLGFLFALYLNRKAEKKIKKKELEKVTQNYLDHLNHLSITLDAITKIYPKQLDKILEHADNVKKSPFQILSPEIQATYDLERLKNLNTDMIFNAYRYFFNDSDDLKEYTKLFANADYLYRIFQDFENQNEKHQSFIHKDQLFIRECLENISFHIGFFVKKLQLNHPETYTNLSDYICLFPYDRRLAEITSKELDFRKLMDEFIAPLSITILEKIQDYDFVFSVFPDVKKALNRLISIEANSIRFAELYIEDKDSISAALETLSNINLKLKKINTL